MSIVWLVDEERFTLEYGNHIRDSPLKHVNWTVDIETGYLRMYITASGSDETYCYVHEGHINDITPQIRDMISVKGKILGTIDLSGVQGVAQQLSEVTRAIQFNSVKP